MRVKRLLVVVGFLLLPSLVFGLSVAPDGTVGTTTAVTCNATPTLALAQNSTRRSFLLTAPSTNTTTVYVGFNSSITTTGTVALNANGFMSDNTYIGAVYCIVSSGTAVLNVAETKRQ